MLSTPLILSTTTSTSLLLVSATITSVQALTSISPFQFRVSFNHFLLFFTSVIFLFQNFHLLIDLGWYSIDSWCRYVIITSYRHIFVAQIWSLRYVFKAWFRVHPFFLCEELDTYSITVKPIQESFLYCLPYLSFKQF